MRIIGYIEHPGMKITVFKTDTRISVKFETGFYEQTYKFPIDVHLQNLDDVKRLVDQAFISAVRQEMERMHRISVQAAARRPPEKEHDFEEII